LTCGPPNERAALGDFPYGKSGPVANTADVLFDETAVAERSCCIAKQLRNLQNCFLCTIARFIVLQSIYP